MLPSALPDFRCSPPKSGCCVLALPARACPGVEEGFRSGRTETCDSSEEARSGRRQYAVIWRHVVAARDADYRLTPNAAMPKISAELIEKTAAPARGSTLLWDTG